MPVHVWYYYIDGDTRATAQPSCRDSCQGPMLLLLYCTIHSYIHTWIGLQQVPEIEQRTGTGKCQARPGVCCKGGVITEIQVRSRQLVIAIIVNGNNSPQLMYYIVTPSTRTAIHVRDTPSGAPYVHRKDQKEAGSLFPKYPQSFCHSSSLFVFQGPLLKPTATPLRVQLESLMLLDRLSRLDNTFVYRTNSLAQHGSSRQTQQ